MRYSNTSSLKQLVHLIESRIPAHVKTVAELRLMWENIVGERMALRSQVAKCEYLPIKDSEGNSTGKYRRRLLIWVADSATKMALTELASEYLEKIPKRYYIYSLKVQLITFQDLKPIVKKKQAQIPELLISDEEKMQIQEKVNKTELDETSRKSLYDFLCLCKSQQNKEKSHD